mgnify:CR=1 FL=1
MSPIKVEVLIIWSPKVGIDNLLLEGPGMAARTAESITVLDNGCLCCTVRQDLVVVLKKLKARIEAGELSFEAAALQFSACPTRDLNGALGTFESLSRLRDGTLRGFLLECEVAYGAMGWWLFTLAAWRALWFDEEQQSGVWRRNADTRAAEELRRQSRINRLERHFYSLVGAFSLWGATGAALADGGAPEERWLRRRVARALHFFFFFFLSFFAAFSAFAAVSCCFSRSFCAATASFHGSFAKASNTAARNNGAFLSLRSSSI